MFEPNREKSYRAYKSATPMSDWGHAMFADDPDAVGYGYGKQLYSVERKNLTNIRDLMGDIKKAWAEALENGSAPEGYEMYSVEEIASTFDPTDIVDAAEAWDNGELTTWVWENVLEPKDIVGVKTQDGAVVFDEALIEKDEEAQRCYIDMDLD